MKKTFRSLFFLMFSLTASCATAAPPAPVDLTKVGIAELNAAFERGSLTAERLTSAYLARIQAYDQRGPRINSLILVNPKALEQARALDTERRAGKVRGPLHGVPVVLKDNIDTFDLPTTAGSQLLDGSIPPDDAFVTKRLRDAGAVILGKANLAEFAGGGGSVSGAADPELREAARVANGFSSQGGQTRNPHQLDRGPGSSSGGSAAAVAAVFAQLSLGSDTSSSVRGPAAANGVFGLRPSLGLVSRDGVVPLALTFDTLGLLARSTYDLAVGLNVVAGVDPDDAVTLKSVGRVPADYTRFLRRGALRGARIGIARDFFGQDKGVDAVVEQAIKKLQELGAIIVEDVRLPPPALEARGPLYNTVRSAEFKAQIAGYLATLDARFPKTLQDLARLANEPNTHYRSPGKALGLKYQAATALDLNDPVYIAAKDLGVAYVRAAIEGVFTNHSLHALLYPTSPRPVSLIDPPKGAPSSEGASPLTLASFTGFPDLVVPAGVGPEGLPVTFSLLGRAFTEGRLLSFGYDFEQAHSALRLPLNTPTLSSDLLVK